MSKEIFTCNHAQYFAHKFTSKHKCNDDNILDVHGISASTTFRWTRRLLRALVQRGAPKKAIQLCGSESGERPASNSEWTWWKRMELTFSQFFRFTASVSIVLLFVSISCILSNGMSRIYSSHQLFQCTKSILLASVMYNVMICRVRIFV